MSWPLQSLGKVHRKMVHSRRVRVLARHFADVLPPGHTVLDVGCGDGLIDALILDRRPDLQLSGVDVFVRPDAHIHVTPFDGTRLPFPDRSWDTVLFCDVLHHTQHPVALLKDAVRVARHGIVIKDHVVQGFLARPTLRFMDFIGNAPHGIVLPYNYFTPAQWQAAYQECRLVPREVRHRLSAYPRAVDFFFGRSLHFLGAYDLAPDPRK